MAPPISELGETNWQLNRTWVLSRLVCNNQEVTALHDHNKSDIKLQLSGHKGALIFEKHNVKSPDFMSTPVQSDEYSFTVTYAPALVLASKDKTLFGIKGQVAFSPVGDGRACYTGVEKTTCTAESNLFNTFAIYNYGFIQKPENFGKDDQWVLKSIGIEPLCTSLAPNIEMNRNSINYVVFTPSWGYEGRFPQRHATR